MWIEVEAVRLVSGLARISVRGRIGVVGLFTPEKRTAAMTWLGTALRVIRLSVGSGTSSIRFKWKGRMNDMTSPPALLVNTVPAKAGAAARSIACDIG